jgi:protein O-GlcNAc transferase
MSIPSQSAALTALFENAVARHQAGELATAERLYLQILQRSPQHGAALHQLGLIAAQAGNLDAALRYLDAAVAAEPRAVEAGVHLAQIRMARGELRDAVTCYERVLGMQSDDAQTWYGYGNALHVLGRAEDAVASYNRALALVPDRVEVLTNRGNALHDLGRFAEALADYDRALQQMPGLAMLHNNRGNTLRALQRPADALASIDRALAIEPGFDDARINRGNLLQDGGNSAAALAEYERVLALNPGVAIAHRLRADALHDLHREQDAAAGYQRALQIDPADVETLCNYAILLYQRAGYEDALAHLDRALIVVPDNTKAINNRAQCLRALGRHQEAAIALSRLLELAPDWEYAPGELFHSRAHCCDWNGYEQNRLAVLAVVESGRKADTPLAFLALSSSPAAQRICAQTLVADKYPAQVPPLWSGAAYGHERIRVAYVSADFCEHPVSYLMAGVFEHHDRERFELTGIALRNDDGSPTARRVRSALGHVIDVQARSDAEIAALMREMEIDIAVDLMGHTFNGRSGIFSRRPAPVQVNYLGFPGTMGAPYMDYLIADPVVVPADRQSDYAEKIVYLPGCFQANDDRRVIAFRKPTRIEAGLPESGFVFCCFNNSYKITPQVFSLWMDLLRQVPGSVLWLLAEQAAVAANLRAESKRRGIDPARLVFAARLPYADHLARLQLADLFLDTLPFNAGTTASDALWAGVPVLTCSGDAFVSRMAASLLTAAGLPELIADNTDDYVALALNLAAYPQQLAGLRTRLAQQRADSALFDTARFCRGLESAYREMHTRSGRGEAAQSFTAQPD